MIATATRQRKASKSGADRQGGFTLLEILVVLTIVAVLVGLASLSVGGNRHRQVQAEANRLLQLLVLASEEAVMEGEEMGLRVEGEAYSFLRFDYELESWQEFTERPFRRYTLPPGMRLDLQLDGETGSLAERWRGEDDKPPQVLLFSDGEISVFEIRVADSGDDASTAAVRSKGWLPLEQGS